MNSIPTPKDAGQFLVQLRRHQKSTHDKKIDVGLSPQMALLRTWQSERLAYTYADLLNSRRYGPACRFFLDDIYAPKDFTQRDHDIERMYNFMLRFIPERIIHSLTLTVELNTMTHELDDALLDALQQLGVTDTLSGELYVEGYRLCDNYDRRVRQIDHIVEIGRGLGKLARLPLIGMSLRLARGPAHQAGWFELQDFLEHGLSAFKNMRGVKEFLNIVEEREKRILDNIFAREVDPFKLEIGD